MTETEKIIESCDDCEACIKNCIFLSHYCDTPRDLARRFQQSHLDNIEIAYSCTLCGLCKRLCHLNLYPGDMYLEARQNIINTLQAGALAEDFAHKNIISKLKGIESHQTFSTSSFFTYNKGPKTRDNGTHKTVFYPGCALPAYSPELVLKAYRYLRDKIAGAGIILNCCGKPSGNIGDKERFHLIFNNTLKEFSRLGIEEVVTACINCHKIFSENSDIKLRTIYEIMIEMGLPKSISGNKQQISVHDACPARYRPEIRNAVRQIASQLDYEIAEMTFRNEITSCCGAGGCAPCGNSELSNSHTKKRAAQSKGQIVSYCAHCRESFSSYLPSLHSVPENVTKVGETG
jgi:Fe-S oxidoreductase